MQFINIPVYGDAHSLAVQTQQQSYHMALTHLVESDPVYRDEYIRTALRRKNFIIMDNSLIELGGAVDIDRVLSAALTVGAKEIVLPDVFQNGAETVKLATESISALKQNKAAGTMRTMAVCHGNNIQEVIASFSALNNLYSLNTIGIPKVLDRTIPGGRITVMRALSNAHLLGKKDIHFLGAGSMDELIQISGTPKLLRQIRSLDTVLPAQLAVCGLTFDAIEKNNNTSAQGYVRPSGLIQHNGGNDAMYATLSNQIIAQEWFHV